MTEPIEDLLEQYARTAPSALAPDAWNAVFVGSRRRATRRVLLMVLAAGMTAAIGAGLAAWSDRLVSEPAEGRTTLWTTDWFTLEVASGYNVSAPNGGISRGLHFRWIGTIAKGDVPSPCRTIPPSGSSQGGLTCVPPQATEQQPLVLYFTEVHSPGGNRDMGGPLPEGQNVGNCPGRFDLAPDGSTAHWRLAWRGGPVGVSAYMTGPHKDALLKEAEAMIASLKLTVPCPTPAPSD